MTPRIDTRRKQLIDQVAQKARSAFKGRSGKLAETFVRTFYANVPPTDIAQQSVDNLYGAAASFWQFSQKRKPGRPKIRIFNPSEKEHGWQTSHTVIEIINDDMPFLVDSVTAELNYQGLTVHLIIHPIVNIERDKAGKLIDCSGAPNGAPDSGARESFMHFEVNEQTDPAKIAHVTARLETILADVRAAVEDWPKMRDAAAGILESLRAQPPQLPLEDVKEAEAFLQWVNDDHFTFLGYREYDHVGTGRNQKLKVAPGGLGVLRDTERSIFERWTDNEPLPRDIHAFMRQPQLLMLTKANQRSTIHRRVHMDVIGVKKFDADGKVVGEQMIVGLFTSAAYSRSPVNIPLLRQKVANALTRAGFPPASHDAKALAHILENYPRDELWQIGPDTLFNNAMGILHLQERQHTALFVREDPFQRYLTALVFVPRDRFDSDLRRKLAQILEQRFKGSLVAFSPEFGTESVLARILYIIKAGPSGIPSYRIDEIEEALREASRSWSDNLRDALIAAQAESTGLVLFERYGDAFSLGYRERYSPEAAVADIEYIDEVRLTGELGLNLYRRPEEPADGVHLKLYHDATSLPLSDVLPMLENTGLKVVGEEPFEISYRYGDGTGAVWIHDFSMRTRSGVDVDLEAVREKFHETFARVFNGSIGDDGFNKLVLGAGLEWRDVLILRAYCKFLLQARIPFSQPYMEETLAKNPKLARLIVDLFHTRFQLHPKNRTKSVKRKAEQLSRDIAAALEHVANLDEDRIIRRFANAVEATTRTSFFQRDEAGEEKPYLSFKIDSRAVDGLPEPRPVKEIFVYSPRMEGCHLRGGDVARGGIRWSDRREDFRTEVLGLQKAQMVKNAVIVPVGSKGGFVCKQLPAPTGDPAADREATMSEVVACYSTLMAGMLDLTDNLSGGDIIPPKDVVRYDGDDPYLVVAADKGTATFSDLANGISESYGFWLGDAYASGGSVGYDHKKMGITARGAWESVKRHFREIGRNIQREDFTVVGVGDMSGDVFGNGMLLSKRTKLIGAFNHLHIFVDPDPDPAKSHTERRRLFRLPRSNWADYNADLISKGGGIFERAAKSVKVTAEMKSLFGITQDEVTPNELIRAMLASEVDLLWFGGIGTYIKSSRESQADADDRSNDAVRVDGKELRCKVLGEGANLAITQLGRIEYARAGGRLNTDFIDNSAGVDASDHEVNIKIVLNDAVERGDITLAQRNELLAAMTNDVAALVLNDNYLQTQAITAAEAKAPELLDTQWQFMRTLERRGLLDRSIEDLPDDEEMADRLADGKGLTRPEYAVTFAYSKLALYSDLLPTDVPDDPYLVGDLARYFPEQIREKFADHISRHRLRREIVATYVTNSLVNRVGATFVHKLEELTDAGPADIARAYVVARDAFGLRPIWRSIEALDNKVAASLQAEMNTDVARLAERMTLWFLANLSRPITIDKAISHYMAGISQLVDHMPEIVAEDDHNAIAVRTATLAAENVPEELASRIAGLEVLAAAGDIVRISATSGVPVVDCGRMYFAIGARLGIDWLRHAAKRVTTETDWDAMALASIVDESYSHQSELTTRVLDMAGSGKLSQRAASGLIEMWLDGHDGAVARSHQVVDELRTERQIDLAMLTVANAQFRSLLHS